MDPNVRHYLPATLQHVSSGLQYAIRLVQVKKCHVMLTKMAFALATDELHARNLRCDAGFCGGEVRTRLRSRSVFGQVRNSTGTFSQADYISGG